MEQTFISRRTRIYKGTWASRPTTGLLAEDLFHCTDRKVIYRWSGSAWEALTVYAGSGLAANIPTAADLPESSWYYETDTKKTKQIQSGAWVIIVDPSSYGKTIITGNYTGNATKPRQITTGFKCSFVFISLSPDKECFTVIPNASLYMLGNSNWYDQTANVFLHGTDGFVVGDTNLEANANAKNYYYWAISE